MKKSFTLTLALSLIAFNFSAFAGDCTKTLMGGGCTAEVEQGVSSHMRSNIVKAKVVNQEVIKVIAPKNEKMTLASNKKVK